MAKTVHHNEDNTVAYFGEEEHLHAAQTKSFAQMIFELLSEKTPTPDELEIFELILNLSIDHGPDTPSAVETIKAAHDGKTISESVAAGISMISDTHGGAIEPAMEFFQKIRSSEDQNVKDVVKEYLDNKKLIGGFGHRIYKEVDPRAQLILTKMQEAGIGQEYIDLAKQIQETISEHKQKTLPLNIDGAIAVFLCGIGWEPRLGKAVFIAARATGLCGQYLNTVDS